jgi:inorganic pyrophosphatase
VNKTDFHCKNRYLLIFIADYYRKEKSKMTADKINTFDVLIEIPRGSRNKYEYDFEIKNAFR